MFALHKKVTQRKITESKVINNALKNEVQELQIVGGTLGRCVLGFGRDTEGELYVLANDTGIPSGTTGVILRIANP